jgi:general stress protein 26
MRRNMDIELCVPISKGGHEGYVRLAGEARFVIDAKTREALSKAVAFFKNYWEGPDDASFTLIEVAPTEIEYLRPNEREPHTVYL